MKLSIIIPSFNGKELLANNLPAVFKALERIKDSTEVIVVDDASTDGTAEWLRANYSIVNIVRNDHNLRFANSCNLGVKTAKGEIILLLNNDVRPQSEFLIPLLKHFSDSNIFAVGCREVNTVNGREIFGGRGEMAFRRGLAVHWRPRDQESSDALWVSAGSAAYRRDLWTKFGGLDNLFRPAYEEDRDISWQALKAGYRLVFEPKSQVFHNHESTNKQIFGQIAISVYSFKNQLLFVWKNISSLSFLTWHLVWLPYHLLFTTVKSRGLFLVGFILALFQLPEALNSRRRAAKNWVKPDEQILAMDNK